MNGITDADAGVRDRYTLIEEMIIWMLFSVGVSLAYFGLTLLVWWLIQRSAYWVELLKSGGLVTYASTLASKTAGEYMKIVTSKTLMTPFCVFGLICIVLSTAGVYGALLSLGTGASQQPNVNAVISPARLAQFSWIIAAVALAYGFSFTLYAKSRGKRS